MSKFIKHTVFALCVLNVFQPASYAAELTPGQKASRIPAIMIRGIGNFVMTPLEIVRTPVAESKEHPRLWPVTFLPRAVRNMVYRACSGVYDIVFYPFAAPFVDEVPPLTEKMGIAEDIWEFEDDY